ARLRPPAWGATLCSNFDRRSLRFVERDRKVYRTIAARSELPLLLEQSRSRSARARFLQDLRPGSDCHPLLKQLRTLSISRETDSAHDYQGVARRSPAGLRRRDECARLDSC